jgi:hypothetical protein
MSTAETGANAARAVFRIELLSLGTIFWLGLGTIAGMKPGQKWRIPSGFDDDERWIRNIGPAKEPPCVVEVSALVRRV